MLAFIYLVANLHSIYFDFFFLVASRVEFAQMRLDLCDGQWPIGFAGNAGPSAE